MSSADILAYDNCTVSSFNFANFIKVKNKNFPFQVLCAINLRSTEMAQTCFSCLYRRLQETMRARMHRTLNRLNGLPS